MSAFLVGGVYGAAQAEHPWHGAGILTNAGLMVGCGLVAAVILAVILALTAVRKRVAALIWR
jgi:hypothetical protein